MVKFKLIERNGDVYHYEYYVEGKKDPDYVGILIFNPVKEEVIKKVVARNDPVENYFGHFLDNVLNEKTGELFEEGIGAWY